MVTLAASALVIAPTFLALCPPLPDTSTVDPDDMIHGDPGPDAYMVRTDRTWAVVNAAADPALLDAPVPPAGAADPALVGEWETPRDWDVIAIHAALLPTGKVLHYSYPNGGSEGSRARLWDPQSGAFTNVDWGTDHFCSGHSHLPDGRVFVTGGNDAACEFKGRWDTNIFNPVTLEWTRTQNMANGRWYPTNKILADGRILIFSGLGFDCDSNAEIEMFTPETGITPVENGHRYLALYPRMHLLSDGRLAHVGPERPTYTFDLENGWRFITNSNFSWRSQGTSVLLPGRTDAIMIIGGASGDAVTNTCEVIDFGDPSPEWSYTASMNNPRAHADALILPDKTILVMGGGANGLYGSPVNVPELFDPDEATWTELPSHEFGRMYHATTVLLPDGRVLVAGQDDGPGRFVGEIYRPPYLFRGPRPSLSGAPASVRYGGTFFVATDSAPDISSVVLVKLTSVTHSVNFEQRLVEVDAVRVDEGTLRLRAPEHGNLAPPGFYMLFVLNGSGVPSLASMVRLEPGRIGDVDGDGDIGFADLVEVLSVWGPCAPKGVCAADLDGDGDVGLADLLVVLANWD